MIIGEYEIKQTIIDIWSEFLEKKILNEEESFFDLGGNSILLMKVYSELEKRFSCGINIVDLFSFPSVSKLSKYIYKKALQSEMLKLTEFPQNYCLEENNNDSYYIHFNNFISETVFRALCQRSDVLKVNLNTILTFFLFKLLARETKQTEVRLLASNNTNEFVVLEADFARFEEKYICNLLQKQLYNDKQMIICCNGIEKVESIIRLRRMIPVLYINNTNLKDGSSYSQNSIEFYMKRNENKIEVGCGFDTNKIDEYKMEKLMESYLKMLEEEL